MFARWRNLAAAAGAIWFPFASAQASPDRNDLRYDMPCTRPGACAGYHDRTTTNPWQTHDRESWYQQYYQDSLDDPMSISNQPENSPSFESEYTTGNDDNFADQYVPEFNESEFPTTDEPAAVLEPRIEEMTPVIDSDGRCDDPTCPCHDGIDLDADDQPSPPSTSPFSDRFNPAGRSTPGRFDAYEPYSFEDEISNEAFSETAPKAVLSGTIEPIFEECDEDGIEDSFNQVQESTIESGTIFDDGEPTSADESSDDVDGNLRDATEDVEDYSADQNPRFHMFYPGCNWSPYQPVECGRGHDKTPDQIESSFPDSDADDSQDLTLEVD